MGSREGFLTMIGRQIGVYRVDSLLGAGGMGQVYRPTTPGSDATSRSRFFPTRLPATPLAWRVSSAKHAHSPRSVTRTSERSTVLKRWQSRQLTARSAGRHSSWNWLKAKR